MAAEIVNKSDHYSLCNMLLRSATDAITCIGRAA